MQLAIIAHLDFRPRREQEALARQMKHTCTRCHGLGFGVSLAVVSAHPQTQDVHTHTHAHTRTQRRTKREVFLCETIPPEALSQDLRCAGKSD